MYIVRSFRTGAVAILMLGVMVENLPAQEDFGSRLGVRRGGEVFYDPTGPGVLFDALDPAVKKWYVPQELFNEYQWRQQDYTNYARRHYSRYVNTSQEGDYFYDLYGNYITRGHSFTTGVLRHRRRRAAACLRLPTSLLGFQIWSSPRTKRVNTPMP